MTYRHYILSLAAIFLLVACSDNPVSEEEHDDELSVVVTLSSEHVHTLSELTFTVAVTDHHNAPVTDFEVLQVERLSEGSDTWRAIELTRAGDVFEGTYTFNSSGDYELRVAGQRVGHTEVEVLHMMAEPLHVVRAHMEAGLYRVEYENFPGHIHEGDMATLKFWVMEAEQDAAGNRPPVTGLTAEIECTDGAGKESHPATEPEAGVYQAEHTFTLAGEAHFTIRFTGADGQPAEADFHLHVAHAH